MFQKAKDVVMTIGSSMIQKSKALYTGFINKVRDMAQKVRNSVSSVVRNFVSKLSAFIAAGALRLTLSTNASAAVPADVTTAITTAATDVATVGAAVIIVMVGIKVWKWIQRAL